MQVVRAKTSVLVSGGRVPHTFLRKESGNALVDGLAVD
jgi:hypothetical protein